MDHRAKEAVAALKAAAPVAAPTPVAAAAPAPTAAPAPAPASTPTVAAPGPTAAPPPETNALGSAAKKKLEEGDKQWADKNFREASFAYQSAVNAEPNNIEALFKLGNAYAKLGYYSQAIDRWSRVEQLSPDPSVKKSVQANVALARQKMEQTSASSPPEANKQPATAAVADSTRAQARQYYEAGVQFIGQRRYGEALNYLNECLKLEPALTVGYVARGSTLIGLRRFAEAAIDYGYAMKLDPGLSSPLYGLAKRTAA